MANTKKVGQLLPTATNSTSSTPAVAPVPASSSSLVLAAQTWATNADLLVDVARLFIKPDDVVADVTYGRGLWWTKFRPSNLVAHDLRRDGVDFRHLPEADGTFDAVAFDPPYISKGGRRTTTMVDHADRFGLTDAPKSPKLVQQLINDGLAEAARVTKPKGLVLVKCQDYISSGKTWSGVYLTLQKAESLGLRHVTTFHLVRRAAAPQPGNRPQKHPRNNASQLLVFERPRKLRGVTPKVAGPVVLAGQMTLPGVAQ